MSDEELKKIGLFVDENEKNLYEISDEKFNELFENREKTEKIGQKYGIIEGRIGA